MVYGNGTLLSLRESASILGIHHSTLSRAVKSGKLPHASVTPNGWKRFRYSDVLKFKNNGTPVRPAGAQRLATNFKRLNRSLEIMEAQIATLMLSEQDEFLRSIEVLLDYLESAKKISKSLGDQVHLF